MACAICETRRPRRYCPGLRGEICALCCGTAREMTVSCPLDCPYLQDARKHERITPAHPDQFPNQDIRVSDQFLREHEALLVFVARCLLRAALETPGAVDSDVRDALDALIRTYRTLGSGLYYETRPVSSLANSIYTLLQNAITGYRHAETEREGMSRIRDAEVLGVLAFLQRLGLDRNNGRTRGRAFIDFLRSFFAAGQTEGAPPASSLILP